VLRIYPAYLVALALAIGAKWVADLADPVGNRMNQVDGHNLGTSLLLVQAWYPHDVTYLGINPVAWSLSCEIAFYAAFPLLFPLLRRLTARALGVTALGLVAAGLLIPLFAHTVVDPAYQRWFVYVLPATRAVEFALGVVLALLVRSGAWRGPGLPLASALFAANYLAVSLMPHMVQDTSAVLATTALLIPAAATADLTGARSAWRHPTLTRLGDASYAFFLVHLSILTTGMTILGGGHAYPVWQAVPLALGFLVLGYAVALPLHRYVETPAMRLLRRGPRPAIPAQRSPQPEGIGVG
jgi:peptidoglycan/LPS O-acetylase OafA/YrhL